MDRKDQIRRKLAETRERTLWMLEQVPDEFLRVRVHNFYSPVGWHFGHVGRTEEFWVCEATGRCPSDERLSFLFADLPDNPKDNRVNIPDRQGTIAYLEKTREFALQTLEAANLETSDPLVADGYAWEFGVQHECQHQETIAEMLQLIQKRRPQPALQGLAWRSELAPDMIEVPGGTFQMGDADRHGYDNEKEPHEVRVKPFRLGRWPVTAYQWSEFMGDGGYARSGLWTKSGWEWKEHERAEAPEYWLVEGGAYFAYGPFGLRQIHPDEPACSISRHEAEAFAKWSGKRLPTEPEWEYAAAAAPDGKRRRFPWGVEEPERNRACYALSNWAPSPVGQHNLGATSLGIEDLAGNAWEWTASPFLPYPGFVAFPYEGYSKDHMKGDHFVCRGGSWATSGPILRCSFRNWYVPTYRQGFLGVRLAED